MIEEIAARLRQAQDRCKPITAIRNEIGDASLESAYRIQECNTEFRLGAGACLVGHKIGLTSEAVQRQLQVETPDFGALFDDMESPDSGELDLARLIQPRIEAEMAVVLARDLDRSRVSQREVLAAIEYVLPCLEVVDSRISNWDIGIVDTVADNASSARFVLGATPRRITDFDYINCGAVLRADGRAVSIGAGAASLGNPLEAVRWLAETLADTTHPLRAGDIVLSGALGPMVTVEAGVHYSAYIADLGTASITAARRGDSR